MQKRGQPSPDDGDALALTFAQPVVPAEVEERDEEAEFRRYTRSINFGVDAMTSPASVTGQITTLLLEYSNAGGMVSR